MILLNQFSKFQLNRISYRLINTTCNSSFLEKKMKTLFLILNMFFISTIFGQNAYQSEFRLNITQQVNFVMDGDLDPEAMLLSQNGNLELYTGFDGIDLYVAGNSAVALGQDVFIFVAEFESFIL